MTFTEYLSGVAIMVGSLIAAAGLASATVRARSHRH
ncbi:hypothetical protein JOE31_001497 [Arthrobacter sp. PvP023]|nr:hypothetical protein [Arthrobacter sp. PvP023]